MKERLENFWYHYKGITIAVVFIAIVLIMGFKSCAEKTIPDLKILYFSDAYISAENSEIMEKELRKEGLVEDVDADGEDSFYLDIVLDDFNVDTATDEATMNKIMAVMNAGDHTVVLAHEYALEDYPGYFADLSEFVTDKHETFTDAETKYVSGISVKGNSFLEKCGIDTENLYVALRRRPESEIKKGKTDKAFEKADEVIDYILSCNEVTE